MNPLAFVPLAVLAPLAVALVLNRREVRRAQRKAAAEEAARQAQEHTQQQVRGQERQRTENVRTEREYLIIGGGLRRWHEQLRLDEAAAKRLRDAQQKALGEMAERLHDLSDRCCVALPQTNHVWAVVGATVFGLVWLIAGVTNLFLDVEVFRGIGHGFELAFPLAVLLVLGLAVVGIVLTDLVGFTHVLPGVEKLSRRVRIALPVGIALALCLCLSQLPRIVQNRSADVAAEVRRNETQLALLRSAGAQQDLLKASEGKVEAARDRLVAARDADAGLAVVAAGIEIATSWAAIWLGLLSTAEIAKRRARDTEKSERALELESAGSDERIQTAVLARVQALQMTDEEVRIAFASPAPPPHEDPGPADAEDGAADDHSTTSTSGPFESAF